MRDRYQNNESPCFITFFGPIVYAKQSNQRIQVARANPSFTNVTKASVQAITPAVGASAIGVAMWYVVAAAGGAATVAAALPYVIPMVIIGHLSNKTYKILGPVNRIELIAGSESLPDGTQNRIVQVSGVATSYSSFSASAQDDTQGSTDSTVSNLITESNLSKVVVLDQITGEQRSVDVLSDAATDHGSQIDEEERDMSDAEDSADSNTESLRH